ncbi:hypothetical protein CR513_40565, partial [Mucuna pruriens]
FFLCYFSACEHYPLNLSLSLFSAHSFSLLFISIYNPLALSSLLFFYLFIPLLNSLKSKPSRERVSAFPFSPTSYSQCLPRPLFAFPLHQMDVLMGPTFTIDVPSSPPPPPYDADRKSADPADRPLPSYGFFSAESSESSSSIGTPDDSDDENDAVSSKINQNDEHEVEEEEEEVHSKLKSLTSLDSLEDSLPIKRGLSNHFSGKSKSFSDLSQVNTVKELQKQENPFNKRRRVLMASKLSRKSSFYAWSNPKSMPLLPVHEDEDDDYEEENPEQVFPSSSSSENKPPQVPQSYASHMSLRLRSFKCRSLSDLKEHDEEEEEEHDE